MSVRSKAWDRGVAVVVASFVLIELWFGVGFTPFHQVLTAVLFLTLGLPHGALDLALFRRAGGRAHPLSFGAAYIAVAAAVAGAWVLAPAWTLAAFLAVSAWHLGESDFDGAGPLRHGLGSSRGVLVVALPLLLHPEEVAVVLRGMGVEGAGPGAGWRWLGASLVLVQHALVLAWAAPRLGKNAVRREAIQSGLLAVTFAVLHPLFAFTLYFTLWHSVAHLVRTRSFLGLPGWQPLLRLGAPLALGATLILGGFIAFGGDFGSLSAASGPALICVSGLTLPHTAIVWLTQRGREVPA